MTEVNFPSAMQNLLDIIITKKRNGKTLDGGCGNALTSIWLAEEGGCDVLGVDLSIPYPKDNIVEISNIQNGRLRVLNTDLTSYSFDTFFDAVALFGVLHYMKNKDMLINLLKTIDMILAPNGIVAFSWITDKIFLSRNEKIYLPSKKIVLDTMKNLSFKKIYYEKCIIEHRHGYFDKHKHEIIYACWEKI